MQANSTSSIHCLQRLTLALAMATCACAPSAPEDDSSTRDSVATASHPEPAPARQPNVLWITIDTLRADHLGVYGYERDTSPWIDSFAEQSIVFERVFAPIATTLPSHTTMFTGVYPHEHGILANIAGGQTYRRRPELQTLAELLQEGGYATQAVISAFPLREQFGLASGFDEYREPKRKQRGAKAATNAAVKALEALQADGEEAAPGFLWVHYFDPHVPYHPPESYRTRFQMTDEERAALLERGFAERAQRRTGEWNELAEGMDLYDEEIVYVDDQVRRLITTAEETGWLDDAVVVITADHGEGLNQHGMPGHGFVWQEQLRVPFILRAPGEAPRRIDHAMSLADAAPTLLRFIDVPGKEAFLEQATGVDRLDPSLAHRDARILGQSSPLQSTEEGVEYTLRAGDWKLHVGPGGSRRLYRITDDPEERVDLAREEPVIADRLN
ncbi:MAG: sulfatase [Planctomycetota bacterium]